MSPSPLVKDVTGSDFTSQVIDRSATVPVIVDFWASWCAPCRTLGPILEREVEALGGRVELAKVSTETDPELAQQYGIQSIPAVKAFKNGKVVSEFVGAQPAAAIKQWLATLAPSPAMQALESAEAAVKQGLQADQSSIDLPNPLAEVEKTLRSLIGDPETKDRAHVALARLLLGRGTPAEVNDLLQRIDPRSEAADAIPALERELALFEEVKNYGGEDRARAALQANPKDLDARYALASAQATQGAYSEALENFLEIVSRNRKFKEDGARLAMLALFERLGHDHDLTQDFRRRLQIVL